MRPFTRAVFASAVAMVLLTTAVDAKKKKDPELTRIIEKCDGCESLSFSHSVSPCALGPLLFSMAGMRGMGHHQPGHREVAGNDTVWRSLPDARALSLSRSLAGLSPPLTMLLTDPSTLLEAAGTGCPADTARWVGSISRAFLSSDCPRSHRQVDRQNVLRTVSSFPQNSLKSVLFSSLFPLDPNARTISEYFGGGRVMA